ncbi:MAG: glutathione S-transferase [Marinicella sp.]|nr:glutathione S-transferase [Xanthomonadales bacterium]
MTEHILYTFRRCPYAIRARMALAYAGINMELRELMLKDKPTDMLKHSPKGTVPVVITNKGKVIDESLDVMLWALAHNDSDDWLQELNTSTELIKINDHQFKPLLDKYKYADRHPELTEEQHRDNTLDFIAKLDALLQQNQFLVSDTTGLADIAIFPFIRQYAFVNKSWFDQLPYQHLQRWLNHFLASELFAQIMPKFNLYNDGFRYHFPDNQLIE